MPRLVTMHWAISSFIDDQPARSPEHLSGFCNSKIQRVTSRGAAVRRKSDEAEPVGKRGGGGGGQMRSARRAD